MKNTSLFTYSTNILVRWLTVNVKNFFYPKIPKMCDPILVKLHWKCDPIIINPEVKMRPHPAAHPHWPLIRKYLPPGMTYTRGLRKYISVIRFPLIIKNTFLFWKWNTCLLFHSRPAIRLRFLVAILKNVKKPVREVSGDKPRIPGIPK